MNRIVREHYPVSKLPEDLRELFGSAAEVRLIVEEQEAAPRTSQDKRAGMFSRYRRHVEPRFTSLSQVNDHVRALRDEWDQRDR